MAEIGAPQRGLWGSPGTLSIVTCGTTSEQETRMIEISSSEEISCSYHERFVLNGYSWADE